MKIFVNQKQYVKLLTENVGDCKKELYNEINKIWLSTIFKNSIKEIMKPHEKTWDTYGDKQRYTEVLRLIGKSESEINRILDTSFVYDENGNWDRINKLNTNYSDTANLIIDIFEKEQKNICEILEKIKLGDKSILKSLAEDMKRNPTKYWDEYISTGKEKYTKNNKKNSEKGDISENLTIAFFESLGCQLIYQSKEGSPIDTKLGIDLIFKAPSGKYFCVQVKTVGSITEVDKTPCENRETPLTHKKIPGGYAVFTRRGISLRSENIDRVAYVTDRGKIIIVKKFSPVTIENERCLDQPKEDFPHRRNGGLFYVDHESLTSKNF